MSWGCRMAQTLQGFKDNMFKDNRIHTDKYYLFYADILAMKKNIDSKDSELYLNYINNLYKDALNVISGIYEDIYRTGIKVRIFSDNIVIAIKQEGNIIDSQEAIKRTVIIEIAALMQVLALKYSLLIRGSVVIGDFYIDDNFIYGKALTRAYNLENEVAIYPRIIIDDNCIEHFRSMYLDKFIVKDTDDVKYINSFECHYNIAKKYKEDEIKDIREILWKKLSEKNTCKINQKVHWLVNRFNEFCLNNQLEKYILDVDKLPRLSKIVQKVFEGVPTIEQ